MRTLILCTFLLLSAASNAQEQVFTYQSISFVDPVPGAGEGKTKRLAQLLETYFNALEKGDAATWKKCLSDSTIVRNGTTKINQKFGRLQSYGFTSDSIRVISVTAEKKPYANEAGTEYVLILEFSKPLNVSNRVSFDPVKRSEHDQNVHYFGVNVVELDKEYRIIEHKYLPDGSNKEEK